MHVVREIDDNKRVARSTVAKALAIAWINLGFRDDSDEDKLNIIRECLNDAGLLAAVLYELYGKDRYAVQSLLLNIQAREVA